MRFVAVAVFGCLAACGGKPTEAAPTKLEAKDGLCVTKGAAALGRKVTEPTVRAVALGSEGNIGTLTFTFRGDSDKIRELASGQARRQLGLKLRAQNGCNLVYVMWRLDPKPMLEVSVKSNPGKRSHEECGANGYTKVKAEKSLPVPELVAGDTHVLRAEILGDELRATIDKHLVWRGTLPASARTLAGPSGFRSDNVTYELVAFDARKGETQAPAKCSAEHAD
jgi:hypothetical protein